MPSAHLHDAGDAAAAAGAGPCVLAEGVAVDLLDGRAHLAGSRAGRGRVDGRWARRGGARAAPYGAPLPPALRRSQAAQAGATWGVRHGRRGQPPWVPTCFWMPRIICSKRPRMLRHRKRGGVGWAELRRCTPTCPSVRPPATAQDPRRTRPHPSPPPAGVVDAGAQQRLWHLLDVVHGGELRGRSRGSGGRVRGGRCGRWRLAAERRRKRAAALSPRGRRRRSPWSGTSLRREQQGAGPAREAGRVVQAG